MSATSIEIVVERAQVAARAWVAGDEDAARDALRSLADHAGCLARMHPLPLHDPLRHRQRIAVERAASGRGAS